MESPSVTAPNPAASGLTGHVADGHPAMAPGAYEAPVVSVTATSEQNARLAAAQLLHVAPDEVTLRVITRRRRGMLGLGGELLDIEATLTPAAVQRLASGNTTGTAAVAPRHVSAPGYVTITCEYGRVSVSVVPARGDGKPVDRAMLDAAVARWSLDTRDETVLVAALRAADGAPRGFGTLMPTAPVSTDAPAAVKVADDQMAAWLIPWSPSVVRREIIETELAEAGVTAGIDPEAFDPIEGSILTEPVVVAHGRVVEDGQDARIEFLFDGLAQEHKPTVDDAGRVDFRDMGDAPSVRTGDELVRKVPATIGVNGVTVTGKVIPAKPSKDVDLRKLVGQNTTLNEAKTAIVAKVSGMVSRSGDRVTVMPIYAIPSDVNFATGNVRFEGNLAIRGSVKPGFRVNATGNVQIGGTLEAAFVEAGGDVTVQGGIVGQGSGMVRAGGSVNARFIEGAEVHAAGSVTAANEIRHSTIISQKSVIVAGKGRIVGGLVRGKEGIEARTIGSESGSPTTIQAGWGELLQGDAGQVLAADLAYPDAKIVIRQTVMPGVTLTVGGATSRITNPTVGGVWREIDGKLRVSAT